MSTKRWLVVIFLVALVLRLWNFAGNVYFGNDQARDAYYSYEVIRGDFKVVGPGATFGKFLHHGVLYYYLMGPVYYLAGGSPFAPALLISLLSVVGVGVVFLIARDLFDEKTGLLAALLYAVSFEESQYAMFFGHPGMALVFVLLFYFGLESLIFKRDGRGLILSAFCAGVATQFHIALVILILMLPVYWLVFRSKIKVTIKEIGLAGLALGAAMGSFAVAELKFHHLSLFWASVGESGTSNFGLYWSNLGMALGRYVHDNLFGLGYWLSVGLLLALFGWLIKQKKWRARGVFLAMWFGVGCVAYLVGTSKTYYYGIGGSVALLVTVAVFSGWLWEKKRLAAVGILVLIVGFNLKQIWVRNMEGPIDSVMAPVGLLLTDEISAIDFIYSDAGGEEFSVHALTIPFNVKSTWDYLFNWYGKKRYGFVPVWGGEDALGSEGSLEVVRARSELPAKQYLIVEPLAGLDDKVVKQFFEEEGYFTHLISEREFGKIKVQVREKY